MIKNLVPDKYYHDIFEIDFHELKVDGIKGIICDIENTIIPYEKKEIMEEVFLWFAKIKENEFDICLLSNGLDSRVKFISDQLEIPAIGRAIKPRKKAYRKAIKILDLPESEIAVIGDQLFTDILGGNRFGFQTILVDPMAEKEFFMTNLVRKLEKFFFERNA